eukprot:1575883-Pyramimonas_sp.AAC.1
MPIPFCLDGARLRGKFLAWPRFVGRPPLRLRSPAQKGEMAAILFLAVEAFGTVPTEVENWQMCERPARAGR